MSLQQYTRTEVQQHNSESDLWVIINNVVYDLTKFAKVHPGGKGVLHGVAGQDCTEEFFALLVLYVLTNMGKKFIIGTVKDEKPQRLKVSGDISRVPYAESSYWFKGYKSPFFNESHLKFRAAVRKFFDENVQPFAAQWEDAGTEPTSELYKLMGEQGILAARIGPGRHLGLVTMLGGVQQRDFDYFHEMIIHEEMTQIGCPGVIDGLGIGQVIGLPPVIEFGQQALKDKVIPEVILGKKRICLAITDPDAGSDVANLQCVATKTPCGQFYIVNGVKKWITNGSFCDYFTTAVRTGGPGQKGISMLLIERGPGVKTTKIKTSYSPAAGTAYVQFENVKVPVSNLLGPENGGFKCIMANFNHERWMMAVCSVRNARLCLEECFKWAHQRKVFGKPLINQPVIRNKLAHMTSLIEAVQNWVENTTYQMNKMTYNQQVKHLAGPIGLMKMQSTRVLNAVCDDACQIFGGRAITRTGMGQVVERINKARKFTAIYGGSEEIMADMGIKMAMKNFPKNARL